MSAREKLEDLMIGTYGMPDEKVGRMLDAYAHELAEEQRERIEQLEEEVRQLQGDLFTYEEEYRRGTE